MKSRIEEIIMSVCANFGVVHQLRYLLFRNMNTISNGECNFSCSHKMCHNRRYMIEQIKRHGYTNLVVIDMENIQ